MGPLGFAVSPWPSPRGRGRPNVLHKKAPSSLGRRRSGVHRRADFLAAPRPRDLQAVATPLAWLSRAKATSLVNAAPSLTAISANIFRLISTPAAFRPAMNRL